MVSLAFIGAPPSRAALRTSPLASRVAPDAAPPVLRTVYPTGMKPGTPLWAVCLVWLVSSHVGEAFEALGAPKALGFLLAGIALRSMPGAPELPGPLDGRSKAWSRDIRAGAMALVLLRAGLGLNLGTARGRPASFAAMAALPCTVEALCGALVARALFDMPFLLAWALGWLVAAVGPAIVSSGCAAVKERGYAPRAPNFLMQVMCFDDALCILGFSCALHAFLSGGDDHSPNLAETWGYLTAPLSLSLGLAGGAAGACVMACTAVWCTPVRRTCMLLLCCATLSYISASQYKQTGAGAIANLALGLGTRHAWRAGWPAPLLSAEHRAEGGRAAAAMLLTVQRHLADVWRLAMFPLLFGLLGASFDIRTRTDGVFVSLPRAAGYALSAIALRVLVSAAVTHPMRRFTRRERLYLSLAWCTKATTQAAFATVPRHLISLWIESHPPDATLRGFTATQLRQWGEDMHVTCVFAIFMGTPLGTIFMQSGAFFLLARAPRRRRISDSAPALECVLAPPAAAAAAEAAPAEGADHAEAAPAAKAASKAVPPAPPAAPAWGDSDSDGEWSDDDGRGSLPDVFHDDCPLFDPAAQAPAAFWALPAAASATAEQTEIEAAATAGASAAAAAAALAAAAPTARVTVTYADVAPGAEAAVRAALLEAGAGIAALLPSGLAVEVRQRSQPASTHPNIFEDPNDDDDDDAADVDAAAGAAPGEQAQPGAASAEAQGSTWQGSLAALAAAMPPSAMRMRRARQRAAAAAAAAPEGQAW